MRTWPHEIYLITPPLAPFRSSTTTSVQDQDVNQIFVTIDARAAIVIAVFVTIQRLTPSAILLTKKTNTDKSRERIMHIQFVLHGLQI